MNETVVDNISLAESKARLRRPVHKSQRTFIGFSLFFTVLLAGWLLRDRQLVNPEEGLGYWMGIVGGSLMLLLLLYPVSKKSQLMRRMGLVKHWFRIHMLFGLIGPLLILYHCNFQVHAINSKVALYSMLAVAGSGIVGRYFYARIHRGLYGQRMNIDELRSEISESMENNSGLAAILPNFVRMLHDVSAELLGDKYTKSIGAGRSFLWTFKYYYIRVVLFVGINKELRAAAQQSDAIRAQLKTLRKRANRYARDQAGLMRRVAQLSFYERLFSLWHVFHLPLFFLLVISALVHVLAVHMY